MRHLICEKTPCYAIAGNALAGGHSAAHIGQTFLSGIGVGITLGFDVLDVRFDFADVHGGVG